MDKNIEPIKSHIEENLNTESSVTQNSDLKKKKEIDTKKFLENFAKKMNGWVYHSDESNPFVSRGKSGFTEFLCDCLIACSDHNYVYDGFRAEETSLEDLKIKYALALKKEGKVEVPTKDGLLKVNLDKKNNKLKIDFYNLEKKLVSSNSFSVDLQKNQKKDKEKSLIEKIKDKEKFLTEKINFLKKESNKKPELSCISLNEGKLDLDLKNIKLKLNIDEEKNTLKVELKNIEKDIFLSENIKFDDPLKSNSSWKDKINDDKSNDKLNEMER